ncbi:MAG: hypothetical protein L3J66_09500 [Bacteroidales bacterium]|nr:hypothetical protein [Bacteroidales bacterium]
MLLFVFITTAIQANNFLLQEPLADSTKKSGHKIKKSERKKKKAEGIQLLKDNHSRFLIKYDLIFAKLKTRVTFNGPNGILNLSLSLEDNLKLPARASFSSLAFTYRATLRSGLYVNYYGINRSEDIVLQEDLYFLGDTIPAGSGVNTYFNTQIISAGYIFSALIKPDAYLGFYFNLYVISLNTGFSTINGVRSEKLTLTMPLPNIGFVGSFRLTKWLMFYGSIGVFSLNTEDYGGVINNYNLSLGIIPVRWLAINLSYTEFNIRVYNNIEKEIDAIVEYNFRGPAIGLSFKF